MKRTGLYIVSALLLLFVFGCSSCAKQDQADLVIYGNIYTSNDEAEYAEAAAIKDGKFLYVGSRAGAEPYIGKDTKIEEYDTEKLITAGLVDAHTHVNTLIVAKTDALGQISNGADKDTCIAEITAYVKENPDVSFYVLTGWEMQNFSGEEYHCPTAAMLEGITDKPILALSSDGHSYWVNNPLMELAGITKDSKSQDGGEIVVDKDGNPLGVFTDTAQYLIDDFRPNRTESAYISGIKNAEELCINEGYVYRFDALTNMAYNSLKYPLITYMEQMDEAGELKTYTQGSFIIGNVDNALELVDEAVKLRDETKGGNFELTNIKIFLDGIIENAGAYLSEPYAFDSEYYGSQRWKGDDAIVKMGQVIAKANKAGMSVHFHGMGDQATSDILTAIGYAADEVGADVVKNQRNAIAHLALVKQSDYSRFVNLNVLAVFNPWCNKDPGYFDLQVSILGEERANSQYPMKSMVDAGIHYSFGTDLGASFTYNSIECFHALATRTYNNDDPDSLLNASEKLSREEVLKAMTIGGAYQMKKENDFGSVEVGKEASLCVFSKNLITVPDTEIMSVEVEKAMFQGTWVK